MDSQYLALRLVPISGITDPGVTLIHPPVNENDILKPIIGTVTLHCVSDLEPGMNTTQPCTNDQPLETDQQHKTESETIPFDNTEGNGVTSSDKQTEGNDVIVSDNSNGNENTDGNRVRVSDKQTEGNGVTVSDKETDSEEVELTPVIEDMSQEFAICKHRKLN